MTVYHENPGGSRPPKAARASGPVGDPGLTRAGGDGETAGNGEQTFVAGPGFRVTVPSGR